MYINKILHGDWIEQLRSLPNGIFHCCITSPPYWGQRNYGELGQLGLEKTPEEHIEKLVTGFREVRRVLRDDGSLFVNYGDKYAGGGGYSPGSPSNEKSRSGQYGKDGVLLKDVKTPQYADGNLLMLPARVALALQQDGWILRSDIIWAKALSFCATYSGSTMPESISGTRWERHRVKVKAGERERNPYQEGAGTKQGPGLAARAQREAYFEEGKGASQWSDCPGCPTCEPNGGLVLGKGSGRCTKAHEHLFQFSKGPGYFWDQEAVKEGASQNTHAYGTKLSPPKEGIAGHIDWTSKTPDVLSSRNPRDVWCINPQAYKGSHYATFPEKLVEPCIKAATSQKGVCPQCGAPWARIIDKTRTFESGSGKSGNMPVGKNGPDMQGGGETLDVRRGPCVQSQTLGWKPTCRCEAGDPVPALVLDPFFGSGTTGQVAARLGRNYTGVELSKDYIYQQARWRVLEGETGLTHEEARQGQQALPFQS